MNHHRQDTEAWFKQSPAGSLQPLKEATAEDDVKYPVYRKAGQDSCMPGNQPTSSCGQTPTSSTLVGRGTVFLGIRNTSSASTQDALVTVGSHELCS